MKLARMRKQTLLNMVKKFNLQIKNPESLNVSQLKRLIEPLMKTYLEDIFLRRVVSDLVEPGIVRIPGRNKRYLVENYMEFDFSWRSIKLAVEIQGGIDVPNTGHTSASGIRRDMTKMCLAQLSGWMILQLTPEQVREDINWTRQTLPMLVKAITFCRQR